MFHVKRERPWRRGPTHLQIPCLSFHTQSAVRQAGGPSNPQSYPQLYPPRLSTGYPRPEVLGYDTYGVPLDKTGQAHQTMQVRPEYGRQLRRRRLPRTQSLVDTSQESNRCVPSTTKRSRQGGQHTSLGGQPTGSPQCYSPDSLASVPGEPTLLLLDPTAHSSVSRERVNSLPQARLSRPCPRQLGLIPRSLTPSTSGESLGLIPDVGLCQPPGGDSSRRASRGSGVGYVDREWPAHSHSTAT